MPIDFVTTAPAPPLAARFKDSAEYPKIPEAKIVGFVSFKPAKLMLNGVLSNKFTVHCRFTTVGKIKVLLADF
jgi:hypothetical protein